MPVNVMKKFSTWNFYSPITNNLIFMNGDNTPFITYPNGVPCFEANMYINRELRRGLSRKVVGGTLSSYAHLIIHLVKFCYENNIRFSQLTDDFFTLFINGLSGERNKLGELVRSNNRVIEIGTRCLYFLEFIRDLHELDNFIGKEKENAIRVTYKKSKFKLNDGNNTIERESIHHRCFPTKNEINKRFPVSVDNSLMVWNYIGNLSNIELRQRDDALYQCMEQLGARITEISLITVQDIKNAQKSGNTPYLKLATLKRRNNPESVRSLPVTLIFLSNMMDYIRTTRNRIIRRTIGKNKDHGYLFISTTTGRPLESRSMTKRVSIWKKKAGVIGGFHPHLFRHAFITNKLKEIILQHKNINSADDFKKHLLHTEYFKMQLQQWTGHKHLHSLDIYINLVFSDLSGVNKIYNAVKLSDSVKVMKQQLSRIKTDISKGNLAFTEATLMLENALDSFNRDIESSIESTIINSTP